MHIYTKDTGSHGLDRKVDLGGKYKVAQCTAKSYGLDNWGVLLSCVSHQTSCLAV